MYTFLVVLFVLLSAIMIVVILLQAGKGQGLAGSIGGGMGGNAIFGGRGAGDFLSKTTTYIATAYMVLALAIGLIYKSEAEETQKSLIQKRMEEQQTEQSASPLPLAPIEDGTLQQPESTPAPENQNQEQ
ncbi:MAG: preprotein translocase subunit SecG [Calditrichae bacterium]|nr:preprotein translocase subunit SecG [Calditrichota bacterium]MCB9058222.1 preprotein translocase subunit SecG [Calditrichia bacterium]